MGQVWLAHDLRLGRDVAVKVLPRGFADDERHRARFEREGRAISALNHPNICTLLDIGREGETHFLVMERIEGESLAERLAKGPLPMKQVLETGAQIASGLAAAHRAGIVHRDLKPSNVMLTRAGAKLLDFGLAKSVVEASPLSGLSAAPTEDLPLTREGMLLGTFRYMTPEQLEGLEADARTDLFALGALLYEMASGRKAFAGDTRTSLIAAIVSEEPAPISELQPMAPPAFEHLVSKCLEKDPEDRWQSADDVAAELAWIATQAPQAGVAPAVPGSRRWMGRVVPWAVAVAMAAVAVLLALGIASRGAPPAPAYRATLEPPPDTALMPFVDLGLALSPDGKRLAFAASETDGSKSLWIRDLGSMTAERLPGTVGGWSPFWSPDGLQLGFFADGSLKTLDLRGGSPRVVAEAPTGRGGSWSEDGVILFSPSNQSAIHRVPAGGGTVEPVTPYDPETEVTNRWPHFLPGGEHFLFVSRAVDDDIGRLMLARLGSTETRVLIKDSTNAAYVEPGYLVFGRRGDLLVQRFDIRALELVGEPIPLSADRMRYSKNRNYVSFTVSDGGAIVYLPGTRRPSVLRWYSRDGRPLEVIGEPGLHSTPRLSPDGTRIAWVRGTGSKQDVWIYDGEFGRARRLTLESGVYGDPAWSPDSRRLAFACGPPLWFVLVCVTPVDEAGDVEVAYESENYRILGNWREPGLMLVEHSPETVLDIWLLDLDGSKTPRLLVGSPFDERMPELSPDGRWFAYVSDETGRYEVYLRATRERSQLWQLSFDGGITPRWREDGREVLFITPEGQVMAVAIETRPVFRAAAPQPLFTLPKALGGETQLLGGVSADGRRVLLNLPVAGHGSVGFHVIFNWPSLVRE